MADMRDPDSREPYRTLPEARDGGGTWGWIVGAVVVVLIIGFIFGWGRNTQVASNTGATPPAATAPAPSPPAGSPPGTAMAPRPAPSTTGQGGQ